MQNFGISQNQPIQSNYPVGPKKKDDKQEKIQKAVTYTLGALAGVGVAALMGYAVVHKGSVKKVVGGAEKNAQKVAKSPKNMISPDKTNRNIVFKTFTKINNDEKVTLKELRETQNVLAGVAKEEASLRSVLLVLTRIIDRYKDIKLEEKITIDSSFKEELKPLETEVKNSLIKIFAVSDFQNYQNEINFKFDSINLKSLPNIQNTLTKKKIEAELSSDITLQDLVLIDEEHGIYVKNDYNQNKMNDDTDLYIKDTKDRIYTFKASNLKEIVDIPEIDNIIDSASIKAIDIDKFEIKQCCQTGSSDNAYYVFGFKENASEPKYIKVSDLSADNINLLADSQDKLKEVINCSAINLQTVSEVLTKGAKYCDAGTLKDAGLTIMSSICAKIKAADETQKANIIKQTLSKITNYDNDSLGKAVVKYFVDNVGIEPEILGKVLEANKDKLCPGGNLNDSGMLIMEAIKEKIDNAQEESDKTINDVKAQIIVDFLKDIKDFGDNSLGNAALKYLVDNDCLNVKIFGSVLKDQNKLFENKADGKLNTTSKEILSKILCKDPDYDSLNTLVSDLSLTEYTNESLGIKFDSGTLKVIQSKQAFNLAQSNSEDPVVLRALSSTLNKPNDSEIFEKPKKLKSGLDYNNIKTKFKDLGTKYTNYTPTETVLYNVDANNDAKYVQSIKDLPVFIKIININGKDKLVKKPDELTTTGTVLVKAIKTNIKDANDIATMLNGIEESKFASGEIGQFVVDAIVKEADATTLGKVLNDSSLMSKLVNTSKTSNELTSTGKALIEAIKTNIKDANDIATMLNELDDDKFKSGKIGQFVVDAIVKEANSDTLSNVLNNDTLKGKLINSTTKDEEKLNLLGQILLKGYANQTLSTTHTNISYSRPEGRAERNRIGTGITINGVRFKFYDKDNEIKYYVGQTR